jgi:hypothetical protein
LTTSRYPPSLVKPSDTVCLAPNKKRKQKYQNLSNSHSSNRSLAPSIIGSKILPQVVIPHQIFSCNRSTDSPSISSSLVPPDTVILPPMLHEVDPPILQGKSFSVDLPSMRTRKVET